MDPTLQEKEHGILIITSMTLDDFMKVVDAKIDELNTKVKEYLPECEADIRQSRNLTPHEIEVTIDLHKSYLASIKATMEDFREVCKKSLNKDYMVPSLIVETLLDLARKVSSLKYLKMQPSHDRLSI